MTESYNKARAIESTLLKLEKAANRYLVAHTRDPHNTDHLNIMMAPVGSWTKEAIRLGVQPLEIGARLGILEVAK